MRNPANKQTKKQTDTRRWLQYPAFRGIINEPKHDTTWKWNRKFITIRAKNCETLIKQTHRKAEETLEFKLTEPRERLSFKPFLIIGLHSDWMIGVLNLQVYNSIFNITEQNNKSELYTDFFNEFSFVELKDELGKIFDIEDVTPKNRTDEKTGPPIIKFYKKLRSEKSSTGAYLVLLTTYARSSFRNFKNYPRIVDGLDWRW